MLEKYFDDSLSKGYAGQNQMHATISALMREVGKSDAAMQAAKAADRMKVPVYQADLTQIQNQFMASIREIKKEIGSDFTAMQAMTKEITGEMFSKLTKGQDIHTVTITPEQVANAVTETISIMDGVNQEELDKFNQSFSDFMHSTLQPPSPQ